MLPERAPLCFVPPFGPPGFLVLLVVAALSGQVLTPPSLFNFSEQEKTKKTRQAKMRITAVVLGCVVATVAAAPVPSAVTKLVEKAANAKAEEETVTHGSVTMLKSDVPDDAEDFWPWESPEDFFRYSGLSAGDMVASGVQKCSSPDANKKVYTVSDGQNERCFVAVRPSAKYENLPVVFYAHGTLLALLSSCYSEVVSQDEPILIPLLSHLLDFRTQEAAEARISAVVCMT